MKNKSATQDVVLSAMLLLFSALVILAGCKKDNHQLNLPAQGSLQDAKGYCLPITPHGTYIAEATPSPDSNYVEVTVDVSRTGTYKISTDVMDGVMFADSGVFNQTGMNTVRLKPKGTFGPPPLNQSTSITYPIIFNNTYCEFTINVIDIALPDGSFRFTANGHVYQGVSSYFPGYPPLGDTSAPFVLEVGGELLTLDTILNMKIPMPHSMTPTYGAYSTAAPGANFVFVSGTDTIFHANASTTGAVINMYVDTMTIFHTGVQEVIHGRFNGTAVTKSGAPVTITNGEFKSVSP